MGKKIELSDNVKLLLALLVLQLCFSGFHIVSRVALNIGVSKVVYPVYRNIIALLLLGPTAYFLEKIEKINIARRDGLAKILGTVASIGGATVITLYKGPPLLHQAENIHRNTSAVEIPKNTQNWTWGCIYLLGHCLSWAGWMVFQAPVLKKYPAKLSLTSFTCFFGLIQFMIIAAFVETDLEHWKIQSAEEVLTILYAGIISSAVVIALQTWCIQKGGPVFVAVFQPLQTLLVAIMAALILKDQLYAGGIIGAALIMLGLYSVLWGKSRERKVENQKEALTEPLIDPESREKDGANVSDIP
ncbi:hypothetical protein CsatA_001338 [Cannabis sativa]